jgi:drug/metabolite transporter (DMT)-like permease
MALHQASGRWRRGLLLALVTAACWATLPVALKLTLEQLDPITLTWFRFVVAAIVIGGWLASGGGLRQFAALRGKDWLLLAVAAFMLIGNYVFYLVGVQHTSPANAQLLIQLAPLLMALGGIFVFGEPYRLGQWCGMAITAIGLALFFRDQLAGHAIPMHAYLVGSGAVILAAMVWATYALIQKQLLLRLSSPAVLLAIYAVASVALLPASHPTALPALDLRHWLLLGFCALNTLVAYGAFAEALEHWEASRVSAILAVTPLLTIAVVAAVHASWPEVIALEHVSAWGFVGAALVVAGSAMSSLLGGARKEPCDGE